MFAVKVGDEVGYARSTRYGYQNAGFSTVAKVNGHGHVTLANGLVFDKRGDERGTNFGKHLVEADKLRQSQASDLARRECTDRVKVLQQKVQDMFAYNGQAHVTPEVKAQLMALVGAL